MMGKYLLRFWFEHGGFCIWGMNDSAKEKFGYAIENNMLPISEKLINKLDLLEDEYGSYLDWDTPQNPSPWTEEHKIDFKRRATEAYQELVTELGDGFEINNRVEDSIMTG